MGTLMKFEYVNLISKGWIIIYIYMYMYLYKNHWFNNRVLWHKRIKEESRFSKSVHHMVV